MKLGADYHISVQEFFKTNLKQDGLTILHGGGNCAPIIYLAPFYEELEKGASPDAVADSIIQLYSGSEFDTLNFDVTPVTDFNYVKERLYVSLVNKHSNAELLKDIPHSLFLDDFAVTIRCFIETGVGEDASFLVHNSHLGPWRVDGETLLAIAAQNTRKRFGLKIQCMSDVLREMMPCSFEADVNPIPVWVMSNERKVLGAATVLFDDALKEFAREHGSFCVIFSSIHEVLLLPTESNPDIDSLTAMNQTVNANNVREDEVLGTKAYYYDKDKGFIF